MTTRQNTKRTRWRWRFVGTLGLAGAGLLGAYCLPAPEAPVALHNEIEIARPPQVVFDFVTTPGHWPAWHPASLSVTGATDHPLGVGEEVLEEFLVAGRHGHALWRVVERDAPGLWRIEGSGKEGGRAWITYTLIPTGQGTLFRRDMRYRMPNRLAAMLDPLLTRDKIANESAVAVRQLKAALEGQEIRENRRS